MSLKEDYQTRYERALKATAHELECLVAGYLEGVPRIERVCARAKTVDSFVDKAGKKLDSGQAKYADPLNQIQDQIGARVIVFYLSDVEVVGTKLSGYLRAIEEKDRIPESESEFGYVGKHFVFMLPRDVRPTGVPEDALPRVFELQVRTLFQHAWSETEHDLGYKPPKPLTSDQKRRLAFAAAQSWGADHVLAGLVEEITPE